MAFIYGINSNMKTLRRIKNGWERKMVGFHAVSLCACKMKWEHHKEDDSNYQLLDGPLQPTYYSIYGSKTLHRFFIIIIIINGLEIDDSKRL